MTDASELQIFTEFQHAYYRDGLDLTEMSTYRHVASVLMVDENAFGRAFIDLASQAAVEAELTLVKRLGVRGFPALLLQDESGYTAVARGYTDFNEVRKVLDSVFSEQAAAAAVGGSNSCIIDGSGCS